MYKGIEFCLLAAFIRSLLQMPVYDLVKKTTDAAGMDTDGFMGSFNQRIGASVISGVALSAILYPFDTFKRNSQLNGGIGYRSAFSDSYECTQFVFKEAKGNAGLYRGCSTFMLSQILMAFMQFSMYDAVYTSF